MPSLVRKLTIAAAPDGLLILPPQRHHRPVDGLKITYGNVEVKRLENGPAASKREAVSIETHGLVGLFSVSSSPYLISITGRELVAQVRGKPIYVVTNVVCIPLSSSAEAAECLEQTKRALSRAKGAPEEATSESDTANEDDEYGDNLTSVENDENSAVSSPGRERTSSPHPAGRSIIQDVIGRKGQYGRFAERWFSRKGWSVERRRSQGMSSGVELPRPSLGAETDPKASTAKLDPDAIEDPVADVAITLLPKLLRTTKMLLTSHSFFFAYDMDITRRVGAQPAWGTDLPLHKEVEWLYFWNRHLSAKLIEGGHDAFVLPLMQGFVGQRAFALDIEKSKATISDAKDDIGEVIELQDNASKTEEFKPSEKSRDYLLTLISRRSILRPGLRYLRRGVDHDGNVANSVETEQILSSPSWAQSSRTFSFTQIRGSIPLFFSQSPYSFKPTPVLQHSFDRNHLAFKHHFAEIKRRYGDTKIVLLVDKQGGEAKIGVAYEEHAKHLNENLGSNDTAVGFEWFDFHNVCRGMKFENVSILLDALEETLDPYGDCLEVEGKVARRQKGVLRVNCMDCLDRTNVVQSACGQRALEHQLMEEGLTLDLRGDASTQWFNTLWADNGDAISKQYSSTAALKGDYTRTRRRDYRGALADLGLTLNRYYNNIVNDYFTQAALDFLLGAVGDAVFADFAADMMSADPAAAAGPSVARARQAAIDLSARIAVEDRAEELRAGWTLLAPARPDALRARPLREGVLLLTDAALYAVRFDWDAEEVEAFERVDLRAVTRMYRGAYVTSTLAAPHADPRRNVGFVVQYRPGAESVGRVNTRSMSTTATPRKEIFDPLVAMGAASDDASYHHQQQQQQQQQSQAQPLGLSTLLGFSNASAQNADKPTETRILAFKAPPTTSSARSPSRDDDDRPAPSRSPSRPQSRRQQPQQGQQQRQGRPASETETVRAICAEIARACGRAEADLVEERDIISPEEARRSTGLLEVWGHELKKLVWA